VSNHNSPCTSNAALKRPLLNEQDNTPQSKRKKLTYTREERNKRGIENFKNTNRP